jgi:hypothetical protein
MPCANKDSDAAKDKKKRDKLRRNQAKRNSTEGVTNKTRDESMLMDGLMDTSDMMGMNESRDTFYSRQTESMLDDDDQDYEKDYDDDPQAHSKSFQSGVSSSMGSYHSSQNQYCKSDSILEFCIKSSAVSIE